MAIKISFVNFKGGVGKTTSCLSITGELAERGFNTILHLKYRVGNISPYRKIL